MRSLTPSGSIASAETSSSVLAASTNFLTGPADLTVSLRASLRWRAEARKRTKERARLLATKSSSDLASHTVQVITDATTSPISTALTRLSAVTNIPQGLRSRGSSAEAIVGAASGIWANAGTPECDREQRRDEHS